MEVDPNEMSTASSVVGWPSMSLGQNWTKPYSLSRIPEMLCCKDIPNVPYVVLIAGCLIIVNCKVFFST